MLLDASRGCQVDDLKKALRLELALLVLSFLRHLDLTDITVGNRPFLLSVFTARRRALRVNNTNPFVAFSHPLPSLSWTLQDGRWVREDEEAAVKCGRSKPCTWIRCLSTLGCAVAQLSGQTATDSCYQLELLEPHSLRHLSSAAVLYTCELASLPGYC